MVVGKKYFSLSGVSDLPLDYKGACKKIDVFVAK